MHKNSHAVVLTKAQLQTFVHERDDLVGKLGSWGADIPTSSMHWKREGNHLQWIVRQMSWRAPWVKAPRNSASVTDLHARKRARATRRAACASARAASNAVGGEVMDVADAETLLAIEDKHHSDASDEPPLSDTDSDTLFRCDTPNVHPHLTDEPTGDSACWHLQTSCRRRSSDLSRCSREVPEVRAKRRWNLTATMR